MDNKQFVEMLRAQQKQIEQLILRTLPIKVGALAKGHFQQNFRLGGFVNNGLHRWQPAQRLLRGGDSASDKYGTLLSSRNHLYTSIAYQPGPGYVVIGTPVIYGSIHNEGGTVNPTVTARMRKFAWAMYYKSKQGDQETADSSRWKALALTRKAKLKINMPKRQFIGESAELSAMVGAKIQEELNKVLQP